MNDPFFQIWVIKLKFQGLNTLCQVHCVRLHGVYIYMCVCMIYRAQYVRICLDIGAAGLQCTGLLSSSESSPSSSSLGGCFSNPSYRTLGSCTYATHYAKPDKRSFAKVGSKTFYILLSESFNSSFNEGLLINILQFLFFCYTTNKFLL